MTFREYSVRQRNWLSDRVCPGSYQSGRGPTAAVRGHTGETPLARNPNLQSFNGTPREARMAPSACNRGNYMTQIGGNRGRAHA